LFAEGQHKPSDGESRLAYESHIDRYWVIDFGGEHWGSGESGPTKEGRPGSKLIEIAFGVKDVLHPTLIHKGLLD